MPDDTNYRVCKVGRLFAAHWTVMDLNGLSRVEDDLRRFMAESSDPVIYAPITDADTVPPEDAAKQRMVKMAEAMVPSLRSFYVVISTSGFRASMQRGTLAGMMLLSKLRGKVHVVASIEEVLAAEGASGLGVDVATARMALQRAGIWNGREAVE